MLSPRRLEEACDSRQRIWASQSLMIRESLEPSDYGKRDLVEATWISAKSDAALRHAIGVARP